MTARHRLSMVAGLGGLSLAALGFLCGIVVERCRFDLQRTATVTRLSAAEARMRARSGSTAESGSPFFGAGNGVVGMQRIVPGARSHARRAWASARISAAHCRSLSGMAAASASPRATLNCIRGLSRSSHSLNVSQPS